jgi:hypothetical protein
MPAQAGIHLFPGHRAGGLEMDSGLSGMTTWFYAASALIHPPKGRQ